MTMSPDTLSAPQESRDRPVDQLGRGITDLRISVTDRCNFRCTFCMPAHEKYKFLPRPQILTFEETVRPITPIARCRTPRRSRP